MASQKKHCYLPHGKKYRVLLNRIQAEDAPEIVWPEVPEMWREACLAFTDSVAALNCSIVPRIRGFMGWDSRQRTGHISARLMLFAILLNARPELGNVDVVIMMVTGQTQENFMASLE